MWGKNMLKSSRDHGGSSISSTRISHYVWYFHRDRYFFSIEDAQVDRREVNPQEESFLRKLRSLLRVEMSIGFGKITYKSLESHAVNEWFLLHE